MSRTRKRKFVRWISRLTLVGILGFIAWFSYDQFIKHPPKNPEGFRPLEEGFYSHGIDVSRYQGKVNWDLLLNHTDTTISFVFCKVTEGESLVDKRWPRNQRKLRSLKIPIGGYHYFKPNNSGKKQAQHFLFNYMPEQNDLPPVIDVEEEGNSVSTLISNVKIWLEYVEEKTGRRPIIYTNFYLYSNLLRKSFPGYKFWVANYSQNAERIQDDQILYWQYTDRGVLPGIDGFVDLNMSKVRF